MIGRMTLILLLPLALGMRGERERRSRAGEAYWPKGKEWATMTPEAAGMDPARLAAAVKFALSQNTKGVLVLRGGKIVAESYADGWDKDKARSIASATKSMTAMLVGMALDDKKLKGLDQPLVDFAPQLKERRRKRSRCGTCSP